MPKLQRTRQRRKIAKKLKPEGTKGQDHGTRADGHERRRRAGFGLRHRF